MRFPDIAAAFEHPTLDMPPINQTGIGDLLSWFEPTQLAIESIGIAGAQLSGLIGSADTVDVDRRHASLWFGTSLRPQGWQVPEPWDTIAGDYRTSDGWIRLHTNAIHHKSTALRALAIAGDPSRREVANIVSGWTATNLETAIVNEGGAAAEMRSREEWATHAQGYAVMQEPLVSFSVIDVNSILPSRSNPSSPLAGVRVLDLTRILAGPVATRFLAAFGADVLRIDPPWWDENENAHEMTIGKRCTALDLTNPSDRKRFETLLSTTDLFLHGYRSDALEKLGYDQQTLQGLNPSLIDIALCAYGWTGPWATRRGFDSLVQMSSGIAHFGQQSAASATPQPLPVQALDHATGYLMAGAALHALRRRRDCGEIVRARLSLARTAELLAATARTSLHEIGISEIKADQLPTLEHTEWGPAHRIKFPVCIAGVNPNWAHPAGRLKSSPPTWLPRT